MPAKNVTFFARWAPPETTTYSVTYSAPDSTGGTVPTDLTLYAAGERVTVAGNSGNLVKGDLRFDGWQAEDGIGVKQPGDEFVMPAKNVTFSARWAQPGTTTYLLTVMKGTLGGGGTTGNYAAGVSVSIIATPAAIGYAFDKWVLNPGDPGEIAVPANSNTTFVMGTGNATVTATYKKIDVGGCGDGSGNNNNNNNSGSGSNGSGSGSSPSVTHPAQGTTSQAETANPTEQPKRPVLETAKHIRYFNGYEDGTVRAENALTRAEAAMIFYNIIVDEDKDPAGATVDFSDVKDGAWYAKAVRALAHYSIINGYPDRTFKPNGSITRAEFSAIAAKFTNINTSLTNGTFSDLTTGHWAYQFIMTAHSKGWIVGYEDYTFRPESNIARGEAASIVNGMLNRHVRKEDIDKKYYSLFTDLDYYDPKAWYFADIIEASVKHTYDIVNGHEVWK